nr:peptidase C48, SUMO/sentrin/Ubl1 [Tanacetum cinerariifolium]
MEIRWENTSIKITMDLIADMIGIINKGVDILDVDIVKDEEMIKNYKDQFGTNKVKPNDVKYMIRKSKVADMNFKLNFIVLFTSIMGEIKSRGLGKGELVGPYVEEEDDPMPDNLEIERAGFKKTLDVVKMLYPRNTVLADLEDRYIKSLKYHSEDNERTAGVRTDDPTMTNQRKEPSLVTDEDFDTPMMGLDTQLVVFESVDKLSSANMEELRGDVGQASLDAVPVNYVSPTKEMMGRGTRVITESERQIESLGPKEQVDNNVLSSWSAYLNFLEGNKDKNSPARFFLPKFEVVFIQVSNNEHKFLLCIDMKNPAISVIDSKTQVKKVVTRKKKDEDIDDMKVASILYLLAVNHGKAVEIIEAQLVRGTFDCKVITDCNMYKSKILEEMEKIESALFNVKEIKVSQRGK